MDMAGDDERIYLFAGDLGFSIFEPFMEKYPSRYINMGVAEQNMIGVATGMALSGKIIFVYSIANFPTFRCLEQIRNDVVHALFPEAITVDEARTPTTERVETWLREAGFTGVTSEKIVQQSYEAGIERLNAIKFKNTSVLTLISQDAYEEGIRALAEYIQTNPDDPWLLFDRLTLTIGYKS